MKEKLQAYPAFVLQRPLVALFVCTMVGLLLRLHTLSYHDYFDDEIFTYIAARPSIADIWSSLPDVHPPLYYMLMHLWMYVGDDLITMRLLSVLVGTACIPALYLFGTTLANSTVGMIAAACIAISPVQVAHSQQARMYPLMTLLVTVAALLFLHAWRSGGWKLWCGFCLVFIAGWYTHFYIPFSLLACDVWALVDTYRQGYIDKRRWRGFLIAQVVGVVAFLPFLPQLSKSVGIAMNQYWLAKNTLFDWMPALIEYSTGTLHLLSSVQDAQALRTIHIVAIATVLVGVVAVVLVLFYSARALFAAFHSAESPVPVREWLLLHCLIWVPIIVATTLSLTVRPMLMTRYLIGIAPPLLVLLAWMFIHFYHSRAVRLLALACMASMLVSVGMGYSRNPQPNSTIRLADTLVQERGADVAIAGMSWQFFAAMAIRHPDVTHFYVLPGPVFDAEYWAIRMTYMDWPGLSHVQPVSAFAPSYKRVWLERTAYHHDFMYHQEVTQAWLEQHGHVVQQMEFPEEKRTLFLYELTTHTSDEQ